MSQTWTTTIPAAETLSTSRTTLNNNFDALRSCFIGPSDPAGTTSGQIWVNTTTNKVYMRGVSSNIEIGTYNAANLGHLSTSGGTLLGTIDMDSNRIINLPQIPTGTNEAVSKYYADLLLPKSGGLAQRLTGEVYSNHDGTDVPTDSRVLAHKGYVDTKIGLTGGTMTTASLFLIADNDPEVAGTQALGRNEISAFTHFNTGSGHRHDGTDARRVLGTDIDAFGSTANQVLVSNGPAVEPTWQTTPGKVAVGSFVGSAYFDHVVGSGGNISAYPVAAVNDGYQINSSVNPNITFPVKHVKIINGASSTGIYAEFPPNDPNDLYKTTSGAGSCVWEAWWNPDSGTGSGSHTSYGELNYRYTVDSDLDSLYRETWLPTSAGAMIYLDGTTEGFKVNHGNIVTTKKGLPTSDSNTRQWKPYGPNLGGSGSAGTTAAPQPQAGEANTYHYICRG